MAYIPGNNGSCEDNINWTESPTGDGQFYSRFAHEVVSQ